MDLLTTEIVTLEEELLHLVLNASERDRKVLEYQLLYDKTVRWDSLTRMHQVSQTPSETIDPKIWATDKIPDV